ncbi:PH domain-containing protein [Fructobacillus papyrifericola]|uniref:PH domain-containing protein n=1 Tax=Fructobacillus papyrifericola TaxID=2713172 RepID=A0ABS5QSD2_9LACO|nr:PH domain-containing protein [Fructobacillus papyrifericola]MBS9336041.1 PH domain-containing protein [Fructobacillus papyrifericola]
MKPRHFHFLAFLEQLLSDGKTLFFAVLTVFAFLHLTWWQWVLAAGLWLGFEVLDFFKQRYWLTEHELVLTSGIIHKRWRHLPYDKIQNIHRSQWFFLKPFQLEKISVDSAGHGGERQNQIKLPVIPSWLTWVLEQKHQQADLPLADLLALVAKSKEEKQPDLDALARQERLQQNDQAVSDDNEEGPSGQRAFRSSTGSLFLYAITAPEVLLQFAFLFGLLSRVDRDGQLYGQIFSEMTALGISIVIGLVLAFLILLFAFNIVKTIVLYYGFSVKKEGSYLQIKRGLFEVRSLSLAENRIQSLQIEQNIWRNLFGLATVRLRIITDRNGDDEVAKRLPTLLPLVKMADAARLASDFLPKLVAPVNLKIEAKGLYQSLTMGRNALVLLWLLFGWTLYFFLNPLTIILSVLLSLFAFSLGFYKGRVTGTKRILDDSVLVLQSAHFFAKKTVYVPWDRIQSMSINQSLWLSLSKKRAHLAVLIRSDNGVSLVECRYLPVEEAQSIYRMYKKK